MSKLHLQRFRNAGIMILLATTAANAQQSTPVASISPAPVASISPTPVASGWAKNSINTVVFRKQSLASWRNIQYIAFYDSSSHLVLGKRELAAPGKRTQNFSANPSPDKRLHRAPANPSPDNPPHPAPAHRPSDKQPRIKRHLPQSSWQLFQTQYTGDTRDAHRSISIIVDSDGILHVSFDQHNSRLRYARSTAPGSLQLGPETPITGRDEARVTYPEFYRLPNGDLLFLYRDGASGNGNLILDRYDTKTRSWSRLQDDLIEGEGKRNAYWQAALDESGVFHISWTWRESPDVASNHDIAYARSRDGGRTWESSTGTPYKIPITAATAEYAAHIPPNSGLINQTSMCIDKSGNPYIATYWRPAGSDIPQYHIVYRDSAGWHSLQASNRTTPFLLGGAGTKRIPLSRPQVLIKDRRLFLLYRDAELGNKITLATCPNFPNGAWTIRHLGTGAYDNWEPTYDQQRWASHHILDCFVQRVGETLENLPPQLITVVEYIP